MLLSGDILTYSPWRNTGLTLGCQTAHWMPEPARFASYIAQKRVAVPHSSQLEDEWSSSSAGSSPEHDSFPPTQLEEEAVCGWSACGLRFPNISRLSAHLAKKHGHPHTDGLFYCAWVGCTRPHRGFNARYKMLVHVRTHTNERPHTCAQCHKSFSRAENLKIHIRSHSGEKPYVCPYEGCGKAYSNSSDRFKHTGTHSEDKPYCCKLPGCNKRYTDPSSLRKHVKTYKHFTKPEEHSSSEETIDKSNTPDQPPKFSVAPSIRPAQSVQLSPLVAPSVEERLSPYEDRRYITIPSMKYQVPRDISNANYSNIFDKAYSKHEGIRYIPYAYERFNLLDAEDTELEKNARPSSLKADAPLNLTSPAEHRVRALKIHPIEESMEFQLVRTMDTPLDLSNKTST